MNGPKFASWESTLRCDLKCIHCGLCAGPECTNLRGPELSTEEAKGMFDQLVSLGVSNLVISGGEFTTRGDCKELLALALERFVMVRQISNGLYGKYFFKRFEPMDNLNRYILSLSLDGLERTHDAIRKMSGSFWRVIEILNADSPIQRTVITTVMRENFQELEDVFQLLMKLSVPVWAIQLGLPEGRMSSASFIGEEKIRRLADTILDWQMRAEDVMEVIPDDCFGYRHLMRFKNHWKGCQAGKNLITILSNGDVTGCPTTFHSICGNIRENTLEEIWNGDKMNNFRSELPRCSSCDNKICQGGCRAVNHVFGKQFCF